MEYAFLDNGRLIAPWPALRTVAIRLAERHGEVTMRELKQHDRDARSRAVIGNDERGSSYWPGQSTERAYFARIVEAHDLIRSWCGEAVVARSDEIEMLRGEIDRLRPVARRLLASIIHPASGGRVVVGLDELVGA